MYRVEDKYNCTETELYMLQARLEAVLHSDDNENGSDGYRIESLYFDDLCDSCLRDTVDGVNHRVKYRIRIYNDSLDVIKLEVKLKKDNRILKRSKTISRAQMNQLMQGECIENEGSAEDPATLFNLAIRTQGLRPKVIVAYERKAYVYEPGNVRITFDRNVRASSRVEDFGQRTISYDFLREYDKVLEVKYDEFIPDFLLQLLEPGNMRQSAYSKYQLCRECVTLQPKGHY
ncbi:MAG: polyphosphate polymerase domain-containing protein [Lachnospiraceae bacterium]|nr:polyphosphate polymerase domain-containing protein [Lachnospiraceae bacterium]